MRKITIRRSLLFAYNHVFIDVGSMMTNSTSGNGKIAAFKTFPFFSKLTLANKQAYEDAISKYPPVAELSFASLMTWWNELDSCTISELNGNLVVSYWLPGDEENSGFAFVGANQVDESVCTIFDYQKARGNPARLVHVPEFVVGSMHHPELFTFTPERDYDESVFAVSDFYPLARTTMHMRSKIQRFLAKVDEASLQTRSIDLRLKDNQQRLLNAAEKWFKKGGFNDVASIDREALKVAIVNAVDFGVQNVCLYLDDELLGFQLYQQATDRRYVIATFVKVNCDIPGTPEYMLYAAARWFAAQDVSYINMEQDLGISRLRTEKLALGPSNFVRKYTIEPLVDAKYAGM
jgi:hypothetical protein